MVPLDKGLQYVNVKQKPFTQIQVHSCKIRHIQELFRYIQAYFEPCVTMTLREKCPNTELFLARIQTGYRQIRTRNNSVFRHFSRSVTYLKLQYVRNPDIFRTRSILKLPANSQLRYIQNPAIFRTLAYSKSEAYSEPCFTSMMKR